jgi:hypothetical protein
VPFVVLMTHSLSGKPSVMAVTVAGSRRRVLDVFHCLSSCWDQVQVSRHGAYTGRRARALERYVQSASMLRVLSVCVLTPLPVLGFVLLQELVPLDAPAAGWKANYRWLIRSAVIFLVLTLSYIQQGVIFLAPLKVSSRQALLVALTTTATYFGVLVGISTAWVFPIPFASVLTTGVVTCLFFGFFVVVVGWRTITTTPRLSAHARILKGVLVVEVVIVFVYPAFNAAFRVLRGAQQLAFLLVLFLLKVVMRFAMAYVLRHGRGSSSVTERWRARLPEVVVFTTELFHVLYLTACLQGQHVTIWATIGLSLFDASGSMISVRYLLQRPSVALTSRPVALNAGPSQRSLRAIVPLSATHFYSSRKLPTIESATSFRLSSRRRSSTASLSTSRRLSVAFASSAANLKLAKRCSSGSSMGSNQSASRCVPQPIRTDTRNTETVKLTAQYIAAEVSRLQTLSMTEYFLLVEYVKCIVPAIYGVFQVVLPHLPNAVYYPSVANATSHDLSRTQANMVVFVAMEVLSLTTFVLLLHHRLKFSVLHQLAFVLETAADDIQAKLAMFIPYCFFFFLEHNGTWPGVSS